MAIRTEPDPSDFPLWSVEPVEGEDMTPVLYGSSGCALFDAERLLALGCFDEIYQPAYVEDCDLGVRAWQQAWPSVFVSATTLPPASSSFTSIGAHNRPCVGSFESSSTITAAVWSAPTRIFTTFGVTASVAVIFSFVAATAAAC